MPHLDNIFECTVTNMYLNPALGLALEQPVSLGVSLLVVVEEVHLAAGVGVGAGPVIGAAVEEALDGGEGRAAAAHAVRDGAHLLRAPDARIDPAKAAFPLRSSSSQYRGIPRAASATKGLVP